MLYSALVLSSIKFFREGLVLLNQMGMLIFKLFIAVSVTKWMQFRKIVKEVKLCLAPIKFPSDFHYV